MDLSNTCWKEEKTPRCILPSSLQYSKFSAESFCQSWICFHHCIKMDAKFVECSEESGWTSILCGSLSQSNDGGGYFNSYANQNEDVDDGDQFGVDNEDDGSSSLASDACSHAYRDIECCSSHCEKSNAYGDIGVQETDDVAIAGGLWYGYNDEGGGYGGGGRNYGLCSENKIDREHNGTSAKSEREKKIFAAKSELPMQANAAKGTSEDDKNRGLIVNCQFGEAISRTSIFQAFRQQAESKAPYKFRER
ncbi:unnamed protein product [Victoria cruziana]